MENKNKEEVGNLANEENSLGELWGSMIEEMPFDMGDNFGTAMGEDEEFELEDLEEKSLKEILDLAEDEDEFSSLKEEIEKMGGCEDCKIYPIPDVYEIFTAGVKNIYYYETFLVKCSKKTFVYDRYYDTVIDINSFVNSSNKITGLYINTDFQISDPAWHRRINIPANTKLYYMHPEYMKLIAISDDLKKGLTTSSFNNESSVETLLSKDMMGLGCQVVDKQVEINFDQNVRSAYTNNDFINFHM